MESPQINLKEVIRKKSRLLASIPGLISWLKRIIHQDEINQGLRMFGHLQGTAFATAALEFLDIQVEVSITQALQSDGRYIFASNHPLGGVDGMALIKAVTDMFPEVRFPVNDLLLSVENMQPVFMPINKHGNQDRESAKKLNEAYASLEHQILIFPAGLVSRKINGEIVDLSWQKHFITKAIEYQRDVVPVYIQGMNSSGFYRLANWRKRLRIPFNIEMLYLPDEMFKQKHKTIRIVIGEPISYEIFTKNEASIWADYVKKKVYAGRI